MTDMLDEWIEGQVPRSGVGAADDMMIRQAYSLVAIAFERLARQLELTLELAQHGQQIIAEGSNAWNAS